MEHEGLCLTTTLLMNVWPVLFKGHRSYLLITNYRGFSLDSFLHILAQLSGSKDVDVNFIVQEHAEQRFSF